MNFSYSIIQCLFNTYGVLYTQSGLRSIIDEIPESNSMYGISKTLWKYGIKNRAIKATSRNDFPSQYPFLAFHENCFTWVLPKSATVRMKKRPECDKIISHDLFHTKKIEFPIPILLLEANIEGIKEPNYRANKEKQTIYVILQTALFLWIFGTIIKGCYILYHLNILWLLSLILNFSGTLFSFAMLLKRMHIQHRLINKICRIKKEDSSDGCNHAINSKTSMFFGLISLDLLAFAFFLTNFLLEIVDPIRYADSISIVFLLTIPIAVWSIIYQKYKLKHWCVLCLSICSVLSAHFIVSLCMGVPELNPEFMIKTACLSFGYGGLLSLSFFLSQTITAFYRQKKVIQENRQEKMKSGIFFHYLTQGRKISFPEWPAAITLAQPQDARHKLTVISNPYCNGCADLHLRLHEISAFLKEKVHIEYVFISFTGKRMQTLNIIDWCNQEDPFFYLHKWFSEYKYLKADNPGNFTKNEEASVSRIQELENQETWIKEHITYTPALFFNGYEFPENYHIEDLLYIL
ncbi:MAG TPA: vitamin K epoxide reductase family protein [Alloprevotella sp.]|nr:vitamin K epoxide reductase family protein [Alloprevotella sp.]